MVFTSLALLQLGHAMAVRSERDPLRSLGIATNRPLLGAVLLTVALQILVIYWARAGELLGTEPLDAFELALVLAASSGVFWIVELEKAVARRRRPA
jgi:P-type Ca2+ transporter type 2C